MMVMMFNPSLSAKASIHNTCNALADAEWEVGPITGLHFYRVSRAWARVSYHSVLRFRRTTPPHLRQPSIPHHSDKRHLGAPI